ncbi:hypothetical protein BD310DRAFT_149375 [Dichomitus squalens]|uniref:Uncharacterized protein n=1 Tax=Dichomitus squalens TaxID=114155 RepID=A0A4V2K8Z0_9APHY|nr:hypothetical protein BD310DRAFT_149375 [Dichomitus squalens]
MGRICPFPSPAFVSRIARRASIFASRTHVVYRTLAHLPLYGQSVSVPARCFCPKLPCSPPTFVFPARPAVAPPSHRALVGYLSTTATSPDPRSTATAPSKSDVPVTGPGLTCSPPSSPKTMNRDMAHAPANAPAHYALLAYAQEMHQYTLELWTELSNKLDAQGRPAATPTRDLPRNVYEQLPQGGASPDDTDAESPQDE